MHHSQSHILLVDDEPHILKTMSIGLRAMGYKVAAFEHGEDVLKEVDRDLFGEVKYHIAFIDLMMFPMNGITLMQELRRRIPDLTVVIITAHATVDTAVQALKSGAYDYLQKPFELQELAAFVERVMESHRIRTSAAPEAEIHTSNQMYLSVLRMAERVANSQLTILIEGETGTGKEVLADYVHKRSDRASAPIVKLNCAALTAELVESELFGHAKGAFTGAVKDRIGRLAAADGGTLFLDEIGEMPITMQPKLLRFLQSHEYQRVGENESRHADVRVIAATNRNLEEAIGNGDFREDLFYRLSGVRLMIPPLRMRSEDISALAEQFVVEASAGKVVPRISPEVRATLSTYDWRGNVRELQNTMLRATILAGDRPMIELADLPEHMRQPSSRHHEVQYTDPVSGDALRSLEAVEREYITYVIARTNSLDEAARVLGIDGATLWRKRKKFGL